MSTEERFERVAKQVNDLHVALLGMDGQGGLYRQVQEHEADIDRLKSETTQAKGALGAISAVVMLVLGVLGVEWLWKK